MSGWRPRAWLSYALLFGSPCLAVTATVCTVAAMTYFDAPPESFPVLVVAVILNGLFAVAGTAAGGLRLSGTLRKRAAVSVVGSVLSLVTYCFFGLALALFAADVARLSR